MFAESAQPDNPSGTENGMTCEQARRQIERLITESELKEIERALLWSHVRTCLPCKSELEAQRRLESRLKRVLVSLDTEPDFNRRLMATLPVQNEFDRRAGSTSCHDAGNWAGSELQKNAESGPFLLRGYRFGWAVAAVILLGLGAAYYHHGLGLGNASDAPPVVAFVEGDGTLQHAGAPERPIKSADVLRDADTITAGRANLSLTLRSGPETTGEIGEIVLAPHAQLCALNRHTYRLAKGNAYFHVRPERPKAFSDELFVVNAGDIAMVQVTGTRFAIELQPAARSSQSALILLEQGKVEVRPAGFETREPTLLSAGQEVEVRANGTLSVPAASNVSAHLAWVQCIPAKPAASGETPQTATALAVPKSTPGKPANGVLAPPATTLNPTSPLWDAPVKSDVAVLGKTLSEGIEAVAETFERPPRLLELAKQAERLGAEKKLSFSIRSPMPLRSVLNWMARDLGLRLEWGQAQAPASQGELPRFVLGEPDSNPQDGTIPPQIKKALENPVPSNLKNLSLSEIARLSEQAHVTIVVDREQLHGETFTAGAGLDKNNEQIGQIRQIEHNEQNTVAAILDEAQFKMGCGMAWYDNAIYLAEPSKIEALTRLERTSSPVSVLLGSPVVLTTILNDPGAISDLRMEQTAPDGACLRYKGGLISEGLLESALTLLQRGSSSATDGAAVLTQPFPPGYVLNMDALIRGSTNMHVEARVNCLPFTHMSFLNKNLSAGQAIEWGAWLSGCGLRQDNDALLVDSLEHCYGKRALQVVVLSGLAQRRPQLAASLPESFNKLLLLLYPKFFSSTQLHCLSERIAFHGDRRQLLLAQRLKNSLQQALQPDAATPAAEFDLNAWRPDWRVRIDKNLNEPFQSGGKNILSGAFAGLLRQSVLSPQLRCTVLVDPAAMKEAANKKIDIEVTDISVGQVLDRLVEKAGLKMAVVGDVIWIGP